MQAGSFQSRFVHLALEVGGEAGVAVQPIIRERAASRSKQNLEGCGLFHGNQRTLLGD